MGSYRYISKAEAQLICRLMLHQMMVVSRVLRQRLAKPHDSRYPPPTTHWVDRRQLTDYRDQSRLLHTMLAASNGRLHGKWDQLRQGMPPSAYTEDQLLRLQGDWVETHVSYDDPRFVSHWWRKLQEATAVQLPPPFPLRPLMLFVEVWDALAGIPDPAAREAANRLHGRMYNGRLIIHRW